MKIPSENNLSRKSRGTYRSDNVDNGYGTGSEFEQSTTRNVDIGYGTDVNHYEFERSTTALLTTDMELRQSLRIWTMYNVQ